MPLEVELKSGRARGAEPAAQVSRGVLIGLVNNMPDSALESTEAQFTRLLEAASGPLEVRLRFFYLPEIARAPAARARLTARYWETRELAHHAPDALIVTGMEPGGGPLDSEPYWRGFVELLEWAEAHTPSSIWSCLAAHAAVQHLSGIARRRLAEKRCGVFRHRILKSHALMQGVSEPLSLPHSRWNDLPVDALRAAGYTVLSWSGPTGADIFARRGESLLVCFQGHPEYESMTLMKEYRRDVGRFLRGEQPAYPTLPSGYFSPAPLAALEAFAARAMAARDAALLQEFPSGPAAADLKDLWHADAVRIYSNWLALIAAAQRPQRVAGTRRRSVTA
ncbi:MAG: homoserine O-succinyltransferase [Steroidobacteraceae bacterium]